MAVTLHPPVEFVVPPDLEARVPPEARGLSRDQVRLMVTDRRTGEIVHARFVDLPQFLRAGDLVVVNISATLPAALTAHRADGRALALHLSTRLPSGLWAVEPRAPSIAPGEVFALPDDGRASIVGPYRQSARLWIARLDLPLPLLEYLHRWGRPIAYPYVRGTWPLAMYQTVYARVPGSAEMPSAGRAFTPEILTRLREKGVGIAELVLHTGVASLEHDEPPYEEFYSVPPATADAMHVAKLTAGRVIAVGTTVVRALESAVDDDGRVVASQGWTDLVITPEHGVRVVDGLLTGFHESRASHWRLLEAVADRRPLERSYRAALEEGYLWHEFGDLHLIVEGALPRAPRRDVELDDHVIVHSKQAEERGRLDPELGHAEGRVEHAGQEGPLDGHGSREDDRLGGGPQREQPHDLDGDHLAIGVQPG